MIILNGAFFNVYLVISHLATILKCFLIDTKFLIILLHIEYANLSFSSDNITI